jgi:hypothetical protein
MKDFIEKQILDAVWKLLTERINEILGNWQFLIPLFENSEFQGRSAVVPTINLSACEQTEKERIIRVDAYLLTISFSLHETPETELYCYAYTTAVCKALKENTTLGGIADRVVVTGKKYNPPKKPHCGDEWEVVISLRVTVEGMRNEQC